VGIKEIFTKNIGWKIGGLILALALWFHLATEKIYEKQYSVEITVVGLRDNLRVDNIMPQTAEISVTATGKQLIRLSLFDKMSLKADLSYVRSPGVYDKKLNISDLRPLDTSQFRRVAFTGDNMFKISVIDNI